MQERLTQPSADRREVWKHVIPWNYSQEEHVGHVACTETLGS